VRWRSSAAGAVLLLLAILEHLAAVDDALHHTPRSAPLDDLGALAAITCPALVIGSRDAADPGHPLQIARRYAALLADARFAVEEEGSSPLAWQGARVSRLIADLVQRARPGG
jgi:pimeloyl-ACP methyl ester carboxylesterase